MSVTVDPKMMQFLVDLAEVVEKHAPVLYNTYGQVLGLNVELDGEKYATLYEEGWDFE